MTGEAKRGFTREDIQARARRVLDLVVRQGTTAMRSHAEVDPSVPYNDTDAHRHIDIVFDLAAEFGVDADFHSSHGTRDVEDHSAAGTRCD
ncbi:MAG TPA: hypothetical protein VEP12_00385 [Candidatus Acidoferrum sp.]|nr:hypothetical protein [Candidatus Acidoferrum sp.]